MKSSLLLLFSLPLFLVFQEKSSTDFLHSTAQPRIGNNAPKRMQESSVENPVLPGDLADPSIIRVGNRYYATGTSSEWAPHFPLFTSTDLTNWQPSGYVLPETPSWAASSFWAPELFFRNGTYYVYYVAKRKKDNISCIGVATTTSPEKGFTDRGIVLEWGREAIDPFVVEDSGVLYMTWKAYGLDDRPIELLGCRLSDDGLKPEGDAFTLLKDDERKGLEGQCLVKKEGYYYLFFSEGACCGRNCSYQVGVARSKSLKEPFVRYGQNPILTETNDWKCPGHGTVVQTPQGADYYLYHAYSKADHVYTGRQGMLGQVLWTGQTGWPSIQPKGEDFEAGPSFRDEFSGKSLSSSWQWDFRNAQPVWQLKNGQLYLSGTTNATNQTGTALTVRPLSGNYELTTAVANKNASLKGLVLYGDADQSTGIGIKGNTIQVWEVKKGKRTVLKELEARSANAVWFKLSVEKGYQCRFFWSNSGTDWKEVKIDGAGYYNGDFLPPWDRSPRPGLVHQGATKDSAAFTFFEILYTASKA